jgi:hypothetical protein
VTPSSQVDLKRQCRRRWLHIAGIVAIGLIALGAIVGAIGEAVACQKGECVWGHGQHLLAVLGTLTAALASFRQGRTAKTKSEYHEAKKAENDDHDNDFKHFKKVSFWWYTFFVGAVAAVVAEFIDWSGVADQ